MKINYKTIITIFSIIAVLIIVLIPENTFAQSILEQPIKSAINSVIANIVDAILQFTAFLLSVGGILLSISINLTVHIGDIFNSMPALREVWILIRNISSIFIIFMLIFSSINTILGTSSTAVKQFIVKIIIAGLLINFSLFFAKVLIDASNLVSLQFYRAIAPESKTAFDVKDVFQDGGLSKVFMSSLKIPQIYQNKNVLKSADVSLSIAIAGMAGILIMVTAFISFLAASVAFVARTAILLFMMAISPLYFAGYIFPRIKTEISDSMLNMFKNQLIFMPVYLFLMYIALKFISSDGFMKIFNQSATGIALPNEPAFGPTFIGVIIQYIIAIVFINIPLIIAIKTGAMGAKWAPGKSISTGFASMMWGGTRSTGGVLGRNIIGKGANRLQSVLAKNELINKSPTLATWANKNLGKVSGYSFDSSKKGYDARIKDKQKERVEYAQKTLQLSKAQQSIALEEAKRKTDEQMENERRELEQLNANVIEKQKEYDDAKFMYSENSEQVKTALGKLNEAKSSLENKKNNAKDRDVVFNAIKSAEEKEARKEAGLEFAKTVEKGWNPFTKKTRESTAKAIRDELNKSEDKKITDKILRMVKDSEKENTSEEKPAPKNEGGDKK